MRNNSEIYHKQYELICKSEMKTNSNERLYKFRCLKCNNIILLRKSYLNNNNTKCLKCEQIYLNSFIGAVFGELTVQSYDSSVKGHYKFICKCSCNGALVVVLLDNLLHGSTFTCGNKLYHNANFIHGLASTRLYNTYNKMISRCYNINDQSYYNYGERGISVCNEWTLPSYNGLINFYNWAIANGYTDKLTIDRKDNNLGYTPYNCRWITMKIQDRNKRNSINIEFFGRIYNLAEFVEIYNLQYDNIYYHLHLGKSIYEIMDNKYYNENLGDIL